MRTLFRRLPTTVVPKVGSYLGRLVGRFAGETNRRIEARTLNTLGVQLGAEEVWSDLGRRAAEFIVADRLIDSVALSPNAAHTYQSAVDENRGVLCATAHLGHWELMAAALSSWGYPFSAISARPKSGPISDLLDQHRSMLKIQTLTPGGGGREAIRRLTMGETVTVFIDQSTNERSRPIPFLGHDAPTSLTYERLLRTSEAVPLFIWNHRNELGRYIVEVERVPEDDALGWVTERLEQLVRAYPTQWVWIHDRWTDRVSRTAPQNKVPSLV